MGSLPQEGVSIVSAKIVLAIISVFLQIQGVQSTISIQALFLSAASNSNSLLAAFMLSILATNECSDLGRRKTNFVAGELMSAHLDKAELPEVF